MQLVKDVIAACDRSIAIYNKKKSISTEKQGTAQASGVERKRNRR
jgi:hypothetical protein